MSLPVDVSLFVHLKSLRLNHFRGHGQIAVRQNHPVERNLQITFPHKCPASFSPSRCPPNILPRGNSILPNSCCVRMWHSTGSPTVAVAEEKSGSFKVHCRSVPAGTNRSL